MFANGNHLKSQTAYDSALVSILKLGGRLIITFFEIFQIKCSYVVNSKKVGGRSPPLPPSNEVPAVRILNHYILHSWNFSFRHLDVRLSNSSVFHTTNRETVVEIKESVRGKDVYIIQTGSKWVVFIWNVLFISTNIELIYLFFVCVFSGFLTNHISLK